MLSNNDYPEFPNDDLEHRLKIFIKAFVRQFEAKLRIYEMILHGQIEEARNLSESFQIKFMEYAGQAVTGIVGYLLNSKLTGGKEGGVFAGRKLHGKLHDEKRQKIAIALCHFIEDNHKDVKGFRRKLVEVAFEIFKNFEMQLVKVNSNKGWHWSVELIAKEAVERAINYCHTYIKDHVFETTELIAKGVVNGKSKQKLPFLESNFKWLKLKSPWNVSSLFRKPGVLFEDKIYQNRETSIDKYGFRLPFQFENGDDLMNDYEEFKGKSFRYTFVLVTKNGNDFIEILVNEINCNDESLSEDRIKENISEAVNIIVAELKSLMKSCRDMKEEDMKIIKSMITSLKKEDLEDYYKKYLRSIEEMKELIEEQSRKLEESFAKLEIGNSETQEKLNVIIKNQNRESNNETVTFCIEDALPLFTGRKKELLELHNVVESSSTNLTKIVISGLRGIGKTQLVKKYIQEYGKNYQYLIWLNSKGEKSLVHSFKMLALSQLKIDTEDKPIDIILQEIYDKLSKKNTLMVFDDATKNNGFELIEFLPRWNPPNKLLVLITSQVNDWHDGILSIPLKKFSFEDAFECMKRGLSIEEGDQSQDENLKILIEELRYFPYYLMQAIPYIRKEPIKRCVILVMRASGDFLSRRDREVKT